MTSHKAFVLAAGLGTRLKPYTDHVPKPLVSVKGKPILDHILDKLAAEGITDIAVNVHHKKDILKAHLAKRRDPDIQIFEEETLLDTGGGVKQALAFLGKNPFFVINGDAFWTGSQVFYDLKKKWDGSKMDMCLLLQPLTAMHLTKGVGDYDLNESGRATRSTSQTGSFMFAGIRLCTPKIFDNTPEKAFSFLQLMDKCEKQGRLYGLAHGGQWHHISTPEELHRVNCDG